MKGAILLDSPQERNPPRYAALNSKRNSASVCVCVCMCVCVVCVYGVCVCVRLIDSIIGKAIFFSFPLLYREDAISFTNHQSYILKT